MKFIDDIPVSITDYIQNERDTSIKKILDIVDISSLNDRDKRKIRKVVLDGINNFYSATCRVLTYIQEQKNSEQV